METRLRKVVIINYDSPKFIDMLNSLNEMLDDGWEVESQAGTGHLLSYYIVLRR